MSENSLNLIKAELDKLKYERSVSMQHAYALIKCPYHKSGQESNPSMMVNLYDSRFQVGFFYCLTCSSKGSWNALARDLNLQPIENAQFTQFLNQIKIKEVGEEAEDTEGMPWDKKKDWRSIKGELISAIQGKLIYNKKNKINELKLPVSINNTVKGNIYCALEKKEGQLSYRNSLGAWVKNALFPFDHCKKLIEKNPNLPVAIVEGPRDALNLIQLGIPAVAILGCTNWSKSLLPLLYNLKASFYYVIMDNDEAGFKASKIIVDDLKTIFYNYKNIQLENFKDPAELDLEGIKLFLK